METRIAAIALVLLFSACSMPGQEDPNESFWESFYGTGKSDDEKEKGWWDGFYGKKSDGDPNCSFYGTCKNNSDGGGAAAAPAGGGGGFYGGTSTGGGDAGHDAGSGW